MFQDIRDGEMALVKMVKEKNGQVNMAQIKIA